MKTPGWLTYINETAQVTSSPTRYVYSSYSVHNGKDSCTSILVAEQCRRKHV